jgi:hypothetical protein
MELTKAMQDAMEWVNRDGFVYAGYNVHKGRRFMIYTSTLHALEKRGLVTIQTSPDGGLMARKAS